MKFLILLALPSIVLSIALRPRQAEVCPADTQISCSQTSSDIDTCCTNSPGGAFLQTQFWDASPSTGPIDSWTIHGLWPDNCSGRGFQQFCDKSREYTDLGGILSNFGANDLLNYMNTFWKDANGDDESFWEHEFSKHATCISTLDPTCFGPSYVAQQEVVTFFNATVSLFQTLPTYDWLNAAGIVPSTSNTYTLDQLQQVANDNFGFDATWGCKNGNLNQVWWGFYTQGSIASGQFIPSSPTGSPSTCPQEGISWLPKDQNQ